ncbi:hypothetical protein HNP69_000164 [Chryseobacterium koreense]|nr:hypothetical protein [Chryseobacterium koreense]
MLSENYTKIIFKSAEIFFILNFDVQLFRCNFNKILNINKLLIFLWLNKITFAPELN